MNLVDALVSPVCTLYHSDSYLEISSISAEIGRYTTNKHGLNNHYVSVGTVKQQYHVCTIWIRKREVKCVIFISTTSNHNPQLLLVTGYCLFNPETETVICNPSLT